MTGKGADLSPLKKTLTGKGRPLPVKENFDGQRLDLSRGKVKTSTGKECIRFSFLKHRPVSGSQYYCAKIETSTKCKLFPPYYDNYGNLGILWKPQVLFKKIYSHPSGFLEFFYVFKSFVSYEKFNMCFRGYLGWKVENL